jgi:hypothetical protein
MDGWFECDMDT